MNTSELGTGWLTSTNVGQLVSPNAGVGQRIFRAMEQGAAFSTIFTDENLVIEWSSESTVDTIGYGAAELIGMSCIDLLHPDDLEPTARLLMAEQSQPRRYGVEGDPARRALNTFRIRHKDGHYIAVEMSITNLSMDRDVAGFLIYARQCDDRYFLEEAYRRLASNAPANQVIESTTAMLQSQIIDADVFIAMDFEQVLDTSVTNDDPWTFVVSDQFGGELGIIKICSHTNRMEVPTEWVRTVVARAEDVLRLLSQHENLVGKLRNAAVTDALTGATNRRGLADVIERLSQKATPIPVALLYIDLDDFKQVNESYGHLIADEVLRGVVQRLWGTTRESDTVVRLGGDEFAVVCPGLPVDEIDAMAQRVLDAFRNPLVVDGNEMVVSMSIGLATSDRNYERLLGQADEALREAKGNGKSRCVVHRLGRVDRSIE